LHPVQSARTSPTTFLFLPSSRCQRADPGALAGWRHWKQCFLIFGNKRVLPVTRQHLCPFLKSLPNRPQGPRRQRWRVIWPALLPVNTRKDQNGKNSTRRLAGSKPGPDAPYIKTRAGCHMVVANPCCKPFLCPSQPSFAAFPDHQGSGGPPLDATGCVGTMAYAWAPSMPAPIVRWPQR
jgi:hypothetical protein